MHQFSNQGKNFYSRHPNRSSVICNGNADTKLTVVAWTMLIQNKKQRFRKINYMKFKTQIKSIRTWNNFVDGYILWTQTIQRARFWESWLFKVFFGKLKFCSLTALIRICKTYMPFFIARIVAIGMHRHILILSPTTKAIILAKGDRKI